MSEIKRVVLTRKELTEDITVRGLTRPEMSKKYGIPVGQINKALDQIGLKGKKPPKVSFTIVDDNEGHNALQDEAGQQI